MCKSGKSEALLSFCVDFWEESLQDFKKNTIFAAFSVNSSWSCERETGETPVQYPLL